MTYRKEDWKPGDSAVIGWTSTSGEERATCCVDGWHTETGVMPGHDSITSARRLVVIDPENREQVERLFDAIFMRAFRRGVVRNSINKDFVQAALREFATPTPPKPYTESGSAVAPWPVVDECHSSHVAGHECPQCAWEHAHKWVAWLGVQGSRGVPVRCTKCGGRKCDTDECALRRHHKGVHHEATS